MQTVIFDPVAPFPYSLETMRSQAMGGTEATVVRIAEGLDAIVLQHNRVFDDGRYRRAASPVDPTQLVVLREAAAALAQQRRFPRARTWLWLHDLAGPDNGRGARLLGHAANLAAAGITLICVSDFHAAQVRLLLEALPERERPRVVRIYNPVEVAVNGPVSVSSDIPSAAQAAALAQPYDRNKLVFFSSPHKGLEYALHLFRHLHRNNPALRLYLANPGYRSAALVDQPGVINLGALPHQDIIAHLRTALCLFYPNYEYAETFGLLLAESNAVGTPVMTHALGAVDEVLCGEGQILAVPGVRALADSVFWRWPVLRDAGERGLNMLGAARGYRDLLRRWQDGQRPLVGGQPRFAPETVLAAWRAQLKDGNAGGAHRHA